MIFAGGKHHVLYQAADIEGNRARCGFTITVKRERHVPKYHTPPQMNTSHHNSVLKLPPPQQSLHQHSQQKSPYPHCNKVPNVPNGKMVCLLNGDRLKCTPVCEEDHVFYQKFSSRPPTYICTEHRYSIQLQGAP